MQRIAVAAAILLVACATPAAGPSERFHIVPGRVPLDKGPDGNSVILDAPAGLILVDTGRHPDHAARLLSYATASEKPVAAIFNTHWHLDHTTGNRDLRQVYPQATVIGTSAIEGALTGFLKRNRSEADKILADPKAPPTRKAEILRARSVLDQPEWLRPTLNVSRSAKMFVAGKHIQVNVEHHAVTEADLWLYLPQSRVAIVGDLVVDLVPFMDTACPDGWARALEQVERTPFRVLIPGHGPAMSRAQFRRWRGAFDNFLACANSMAAASACVSGWERDAAEFIPDSHRTYVREAATYYLKSRLRAPEPEKSRYCPPPTGEAVLR